MGKAVSIFDIVASQQDADGAGVEHPDLLMRPSGADESLGFCAGNQAKLKPAIAGAAHAQPGSATLCSPIVSASPRHLLSAVHAGR